MPGAGPAAWGWDEDERWTLARIAVVRRRFGVTYTLAGPDPVRSHLKNPLANLAKRNLAQLTILIKTRLRRRQYRPSLLDGFLASTGLDLPPFCNPRDKDCFSPALARPERVAGSRQPGNFRRWPR